MFAPVDDGIPQHLEEMEPGPYLAGFLSAIDVTRLSGRHRIIVLQAHQRMASHYAAQVYEDMAAVTDAMGEFDEDPQWAVEAAAAEVRAALRLTRRAADSELALDLRRRLPAVWDALAAGTIDVRRARVIASGTSHLSAAVANEVVDHIIANAGLLTTGQLAARIRRLAMEVDPDEATRLYDRSVADRRVVAQPNPDGTTDLFSLNMPSAEGCGGTAARESARPRPAGRVRVAHDGSTPRRRAARSPRR